MQATRTGYTQATHELSMRLLLCIFVVLIAHGLNAQSAWNTHRHAVRTDKKPFGMKEYSSVGLSLHFLNYYGDLSPMPHRVRTHLPSTRPGIGVSYFRKKGPQFGVQGELLYGEIRAADVDSADPKDASNGIYRYNRNLSFRNRLVSLSGLLVFDLHKNNGYYHHRVHLTPYAFAGLSVFYHNPKAKAPLVDLHGNALPEGGRWVSLRPLGTEGQYARLEPGDANFGIRPYALVQPSFPVGAGMRQRIHHIWDVSAEVRFWFLFTDYVDDVSQNYVDLGVLKTELARAMAYRSNEVQTAGNKFITSAVTMLLTR